MQKIQLTPQQLRLVRKSVELKRKWQREQARLSQRPKPPQPRKKARKKESKAGIPPKPKVKFNETALGKWMAIHAPLELQMLNDTIRQKIRSAGYVTRYVESIARTSDNPAFRSPEFRVAFIEFKRKGLRPDTKADWSTDDVVAAAISRRNSLIF